MTDLESDLVKRKESIRGNAPETVREAVCALANDLPNHGRPGVVFIGVRDDGAATGLPITDELLLTLADIKTDGNITPPPTLTVGKGCTSSWGRSQRPRHAAQGCWSCRHLLQRAGDVFCPHREVDPSVNVGLQVAR